MITIKVTIQVSADTARELSKGEPLAPEIQELLGLVKGFALKVEPQYSGAQDRGGPAFLEVAVPERATADKLIARLLQCKVVEGAYFTPPDEAAM